MIVEVRIESRLFDPGEEAARLVAGRADVGALVSFAGYCRDEGGRLAALELDHYPGMAEDEIARIGAEAAGRWALSGLLVVHRHGLIRPGEPIVVVAAASAHRASAFAATEFVMDYLKTRAPFWKKEHRADGSEGAWVAPKDSDEAATRRW